LQEDGRRIRLDFEGLVERLLGLVEPVAARSTSVPT